MKQALGIIKFYEGLRLEPYLCPGGVPTIGYGTIVYPDGKKVSLEDKKITKKKATELLTFYVSNTMKLVTGFLKNNNIQLSVHEICSLTSFCYNLGMSPLITSGRSLNKAVLSKDRVLMAEAMRLYVHADGVKLKGLVNRRNTEATLLLTGELFIKGV